MFTLRPYQQDAVNKTLEYFRKNTRPAVIVLPTGAGKSLVIAELARLAKQKILVLAHVKELVEQNAKKYRDLGLTPSIFSAGLNEKSLTQQVTFASVQSLARNINQLKQSYSLLIIDECHRLNGESQSQYEQIITQLKKYNPQLKILGLTATPYRLGMGWIYHRHYHGFVRGKVSSPFYQCIYELPLFYMIKKGYLSPAKQIDAAITHYDFKQLSGDKLGKYQEKELNQLLKSKTRATKAIIEHVIAQAAMRQGVMIFAATIHHAQEVFSYLPTEQAALITGETPRLQRDELIAQFKQKKFKYLVNVAVLTTGFDAPHVDFIAILRPTESVSLYQQIVGRGLRLSANKPDCLVIDYAGNGFDIFYPEVGEKQPHPDSQPVQISCPQCDFANTFWGRVDAQGQVIEHYGRRCQGLVTDEQELTTEKAQSQQCDYRFKFKQCPHCNAENDIAARQCHGCAAQLVDPDDKLRQALNLKNALVLRCSGLLIEKTASQKIKISYFDEDGASCAESVDFTNAAAKKRFNQDYGKRHLVAGLTMWEQAEQVINQQHLLVAPDFVIARQSKKYGWQIQEKIFDYQGNFRKAHALS